ncbi:MAG TPA: hypothetical protein VL463_08740 [Kofleriaceae bacterium]|nr:hypothetical protein [Kofleriaceae bacterium]
MSDFEGTLVLEQLERIGRLDEFMDAVDEDDVERATRLMRRARIDAQTIATVRAKMRAADGKH